jgi:hypothetical protein
MCVRAGKAARRVLRRLAWRQPGLRAAPTPCSPADASAHPISPFQWTRVLERHLTTTLNLARQT